VAISLIISVGPIKIGAKAEFGEIGKLAQRVNKLAGDIIKRLESADVELLKTHRE